MAKPTEHPPPSGFPPPASWMHCVRVLRSKAEAKIGDEAWTRVWTAFIEGLEEEDLDVPTALRRALKVSL